MSLTRRDAAFRSEWEVDHSELAVSRLKGGSLTGRSKHSFLRFLRPVTWPVMAWKGSAFIFEHARWMRSQDGLSDGPSLRASIHPLA